MDSIDLPPSVHRAITVELIAKSPPGVVDDIVAALCERIRAVEKTETGAPSQVERVARLLRAFDRSVHLAPIVYDALRTDQLRALLVLALDQFAIDAPPGDAAIVAAAADRYVRAVREPSIDEVVRSPLS